MAGLVGELGMMVLKDLWLAWERRRERRRSLASRQGLAWWRVTGRSGGKRSRGDEDF